MTIKFDLPFSSALACSLIALVYLVQNRKHNLMLTAVVDLVLFLLYTLPAQTTQHSGAKQTLTEIE